MSRLEGSCFFPLLFVPQTRPNPFNPSIGTRPEQKLEHSKTINLEKSEKNVFTLNFEWTENSFNLLKFRNLLNFEKQFFWKKLSQPPRLGAVFLLLQIQTHFCTTYKWPSKVPELTNSKIWNSVITFIFVVKLKIVMELLKGLMHNCLFFEQLKICKKIETYGCFL